VEDGYELSSFGWDFGRGLFLFLHQTQASVNYFSAFLRFYLWWLFAFSPGPFGFHKMGFKFEGKNSAVIVAVLK
jgi:hypothetical protein